MERSLKMKTWMTCSGTWVLLWHALWHADTQPVQPISVHVSLALSPLGFSCVSVCGP
jgi:hypothetical protein